MSDNIEIIMDMDSLKIFDVIDLDGEKESAVIATEDGPEEVKASPYDDLGRVWLGNGYFYKPSSLLWKVEKEGVIHELKPQNKHGTYPYYKHCKHNNWGQVDQLTQDEALWLTLEFNPELLDLVN